MDLVNLKNKILMPSVKHLYQNIMELYNLGFSGKEISDKLGFKHSNSVRQIIKKKGYIRTQSEASSLAVSKGKKEKATAALIISAKTTNRNNPEKARWSGNMELHPRWIKDRSQLKSRPKQNVQWRNEVFVRDNYTCQMCGQYGNSLCADHIKPYAIFPELRLDINNGRTLCITCHKKTPSYAKKVSSQLKIYANAIS